MMDTSEKMFEQACRVMPGGVNSPVRAYRAVGMTPRFIRGAKGAYITDVDAGHGLLKIGSSLVPFENHFPRGTRLYQLMTTKPADRE